MTKNSIQAIEGIVEDSSDFKELSTFLNDNNKNNDIGENLKKYFNEEIKYFKMQSAFGEKITEKLLDIIDDLSVHQLMVLQERINESKNQSLESITSMLSKNREYSGNNDGLLGLGGNKDNLKSIVIEYSSPQEKFLADEVSKRLENFHYKDIEE